MFRLDCQIMPYAWGSRTAIAALCGRPHPTAQPEAELWMGAHPAAPSRAGGDALDRLIDQSPGSALGAASVARFGPRLPFLMKVLAADQPLSLQVHPSVEQAREGFAREDQGGVPLGAPHRTYKDANHKPELIYALERFEALSGFRPLDEARDVLRALGVAPLDALVAAGSDASPRELFTALVRLERERRGPLVSAVAHEAARLGAGRGPHAAAYAWAAELGSRYPGDPGVIAALMLRYVVLEPGQAMYLPAGNLHAYLRGVGIEIMASSDNVLRGGLTPKHVDVDELLRILDFDAQPPALVAPNEVRRGEHAYATPAPDFALSRIELAGADALSLDVTAAEIVFCARGRVTLAGTTDLVLVAGQSAFVPAAARRYSLVGSGTVFRATARV